LLVDGLKKYLDKHSPAREMEVTKKTMCSLYEKIQNLQMERFFETINERQEK
jgi:hypothetical protein